jgi:hypothetical protein
MASHAALGSGTGLASTANCGLELGGPKLTWFQMPLPITVSNVWSPIVHEIGDDSTVESVPFYCCPPPSPVSPSVNQYVVFGLKMEPVEL